MKHKRVASLLLLLLPFALNAQSDSTYAEHLGFPKGARVLILHLDGPSPLSKKHSKTRVFF